tara:strand:- start:243 stop:812 length:570 start_codon:yes stop_codon:yes gene_type:complete
MKNTAILLSILFISISIFNSCASKKATAKAVGDVEIKIPCSNFKSDKDFFRGNQSANSSDLANSREQALMMAKNRLAGLISTKMKNVSQRYAGDRKIGNTSEFNQKFESMTRSVVDQLLLDVNIVCEKTLQKADGSYNTFIAVECKKETIYNGVSEGISNDQKLRQDYDVMKFKEIFDEEMEKLEEEQP